MGKYTKMALVLLYLLQLVIVFRDQLAHIYRNALESVHHEADQADLPRADNGIRAVFEKVVRVSRPGVRATMSAGAPAVAALSTILSGDGADDGPEEHHHDDDDKKDKARKHRHRFLVEYLLHNFWSGMRKAPATPSSLAERCSDIVRVILFAEAGMQA